ncbi:uncharacterized protein LOC125153780 isoform X3 [Prionailurus viverrinus]|uniref:uncharacterized protein LOC125153780 isoform X3 n=1 Tax=Prionailurus viverrinus TaxID=61388 RepID=UPI001FF6A6AA|nr:uncharacterized protein LOC125153780 isoform X3 [Prionailurus viverrinus]
MTTIDLDPDLGVCCTGRNKWRPNRDLRQQGGKRKRTARCLIQDEEAPRWVPLRLLRDITVAPKNGQFDSDGTPPKSDDGGVIRRVHPPGDR